MECVEVIGGLDYDDFSRSTANTDEFVWIKMNERGEFAGLSWSKVIVQEMAWFYGCILKMFVNHHQLGDYWPYFTDPVSVNLLRNYSALLKDDHAWALCCFSL